MGSVYVIRKELQQVLTPTGLQMQYAVGQSNSAPQSVAGVNPEGMAGLQTNPMNQQFEARPQMDESGKTEIGVYQGDKYGAKALNQMKPEASMNAQTAFDRGSKWGQAGHNLGEGLATGLGIMGGAVALANAGAQGQDAFSGGLNAFQMGQMARDQTKKPLSEGLGGAAANLAGRSVGVTRPEVASPTPVAVAPPTTNTHTDEEMINMRGAKGQIMTQGTQGFDVPFKSPAGRRAAEHKTRRAQGHDMTVNTNEAAIDPMGQPTHIGTEETGVVTGGGPQGTLPTGNIGEDIHNQELANQGLVNVASPNPEQRVDQTVEAITNATNTQSQLPGVGVKNTVNEINNAINPAEGSDPKNPAAEVQSGEKQSMAKDGLGKMVGVSGSKRMVGVY
jgi:hypothetical protein